MTTHRQQIKEQLAMLEERLEELGALASAQERSAIDESVPPRFGSDVLFQEASGALNAFAQLVQEQQWHKSVPAADFLQRVTALLLKEAAANSVDLAVSHFGEGKVSMELAELMLGAVLASLRASVKGLASQSRPDRFKNHLFPTGSVYLEVRATSGEVRFRIADDGPGLRGGVSFAGDSQIRRLREHVARSGGWFSHASLTPHGGAIEFKVPLTQGRAEAVALRDGAFELLLSSLCVAEVRQGGTGDFGGQLESGSAVLRLDKTEGLVPGGASSPTLVRIRVADLQFWIGCEAVSSPTRARRIPADAFVEDGSWLRLLGLFHENGAGRALPMLDDSALVRFHDTYGGSA